MIGRADLNKGELMGKMTPPDNLDQVYERIRSVLTEARNRAYQAINAAMVAAYWEIGPTIVEEEQQGAQRAEYGKQILVGLSLRLTEEFGRGFDRTNLQQMRNFFLDSLPHPVACRKACRQELLRERGRQRRLVHA